MVGARVGEIPLDDPPTAHVRRGRPAGGQAAGDEVWVDDTSRWKARRVMFDQLPWGSVPGWAPIACDVSDRDTMLNGFAKRLGRENPPASKQTLAELRDFVRGWASTLPKLKPWSYARYREHQVAQGIPAHRLAQLDEAHASLRGGAPSRREISRFQSFGKVESYADYKWPRHINAPSDRVKVWFGCYVGALEEVIFRYDPGEEYPKFVKKVPVAARARLVAALEKLGLPIWSADHSAFEAGLHAALMEATACVVYERVFSGDEFLPLIRYALLCACELRGETADMFIVSRRKSGANDTALFNTLINWLTEAFLVSRKGGRWFGLCEGDDSLFATDVVLTSADYAELGMVCNPVRVSSAMEASFCGIVAGPVGEMMRDPLPFLQKFGWTASCIGAGRSVKLGLLRAKALSAAVELPQCPIVGAVARKALEITRDVAPRWEYDAYRGRLNYDERSVVVFNPHPTTRETFARLYGVSVAAQVAIEAKIARGDMDILSSLLPTASGAGPVAGEPSAVPFAANHAAARFVERR